MDLGDPIRVIEVEPEPASPAFPDETLTEPVEEPVEVPA